MKRRIATSQALVGLIFALKIRNISRFRETTALRAYCAQLGFSVAVFRVYNRIERPFYNNDRIFSGILEVISDGE